MSCQILALPKENIGKMMGKIVAVMGLNPAVGGPKINGPEKFLGNASIAEIINKASEGVVGKSVMRKKRDGSVA